LYIQYHPIIAYNKKRSLTLDYTRLVGRDEDQCVALAALSLYRNCGGYNEFIKSFNEYLTATAGQRLDLPISLLLQPLNFLTLFCSAEDASIDFIYVKPSAYLRIESEYEAHSLASQISPRKINGRNLRVSLLSWPIERILIRNMI
jgi:hypothetical protein